MQGLHWENSVWWCLDNCLSADRLFGLPAGKPYCIAARDDQAFQVRLASPYSLVLVMKDLWLWQQPRSTGLMFSLEMSSQNVVVLDWLTWFVLSRKSPRLCLKLVAACSRRLPCSLWSSAVMSKFLLVDWCSSLNRFPFQNLLCHWFLWQMLLTNVVYLIEYHKFQSHSCLQNPLVGQVDLLIGYNLICYRTCVWVEHLSFQRVIPGVKLAQSVRA